jgi:malonyl-CoA O-methyltransferase
MMKSPEEYAEAAVIARAASEEMLSRLALMTLQPKTILDLGCATGESSEKLQVHYPDAQVLAVDWSLAMTQYAKHTLPNLQVIAADGALLPLPTHSMDLIFANFFLAWQQDVKIIMREWMRVLRPNGLLMLSTLGVDTLQEWRGQFPEEDTPRCVDMHDVGDALIQAGFSEPVLDVNHYHLNYQEPTRLLKDMVAAQMWYPTEEHAMMPLKVPEGQSQAKLQLTYEVIYAHAFGRPLQNEFSASEEGIVKIPLAHLRRNKG